MNDPVLQFEILKPREPEHLVTVGFELIDQGIHRAGIAIRDLHRHHLARINIHEGQNLRHSLTFGIITVFVAWFCARGLVLFFRGFCSRNRFHRRV